MIDFTEMKFGDEVWCVVCGRCKIIEIDKHDLYCIGVQGIDNETKFKRYTRFGFRDAKDTLPSLYVKKPLLQSSDDDFESKATKVALSVIELLVEKNKKYGNSALKPVRIFSKASPIEQILVRIDDKLSRISTQDLSEDEDVLQDLMGYLVLLKIAQDEAKR